MNACLPSRSATLTLMVLTVVLAAVGQAGPGAAAGVPGLSLPAVKLSAFGPLPPQQTLKVTPALQDSATTVEKAANYKGVREMLGIQLTADQEKFLNEHKFLLIPKRATRFKGSMDEGWEYDEMLGMFDEVGGSWILWPPGCRKMRAWSRPTWCSTAFTNILKTRWNIWKDST